MTVAPSSLDIVLSTGGGSDLMLQPLQEKKKKQFPQPQTVFAISSSSRSES